MRGSWFDHDSTDVKSGFITLSDTRWSAAGGLLASLNAYNLPRLQRVRIGLRLALERDPKL